MAEAHGRDEWSRASQLWALIANCHRDPKKSHEFLPSDIDPYSKPVKPLKADISVLKAMLRPGKQTKRKVQ